MKTRFLFAIAVLAGFTAAAQNTGIGIIIPTDQLHTTGTVRFQNYSGTGTRLLYIDSIGRITTPPTTAVFTNNTSYAIPDNGCATGSGASSPITVTGMGAAIPSSNILVRINIAHTYDGDLSIFLQAPNGNTIRLASTLGSSGDNYTNTIFTDGATTPIANGTPPFTGQFTPSAGIAFSCGITPSNTSFSSIGGGSIVPNGTWTLRVFDGAAQDVGTINNWQIFFDGPYSFGTTGATGPVAYFKNGSLKPGSITNASNGNVGINNAAPAYNLDVNGTSHTTGNTVLDGTIKIGGGAPATGYVLTSTNGTGLADWEKPGPYNSGFNGVLLANGPTIASGTTAVIPFGAIGGGSDFDDANGFGAAPPFNYTVPASGVYQLNVQAITSPATAAATGNAIMIIKVNGASGGLPRDIQSVTAGVALRTKWNISTVAKLAGGDVLTVEFSNSTGTTISLPTVLDTQFSGVRLY